MEKNEDSDLLELQVNPIFVHARSAVHSFRGDKYLTQTDIADFRIYNYAVSNQVLWQLEQLPTGRKKEHPMLSQQPYYDSSSSAKVQRKNDNAKFFRRQIALCHCFYEKD